MNFSGPGIERVGASGGYLQATPSTVRSAAMRVFLANEVTSMNAPRLDTGTNQATTSALVEGMQPGDRLTNVDFAAHNAEVKAMWAAFNKRQPYRIPTILGTNTRYFMFNSSANPRGVQFRDSIENPDLMFDMSLQFQRWLRFNLLQDYELGMPERWTVTPDFQNFYEAACSVVPFSFSKDRCPTRIPPSPMLPSGSWSMGCPIRLAA